MSTRRCSLRPIIPLTPGRRDARRVVTVISPVRATQGAQPQSRFKLFARSYRTSSSPTRAPETRSEKLVLPTSPEDLNVPRVSRRPLRPHEVKREEITVAPEPVDAPTIKQPHARRKGRKASTISLRLRDLCVSKEIRHVLFSRNLPPRQVYRHRRPPAVIVETST